MTTNPLQISDAIFRSRKNLITMLKDRGYNTSDYDNFTSSDVTNMLSNFGKNKDNPEQGSLDILVSDTKKRKIYVKYLLDKFKQSKSLNKLITDIFDKVIKPSDTLIFILSETVIFKPSKENKIEEFVNSIYIKEKLFLQFFGVENLLFNVSKHENVPKHIKMSDQDIQELMTQYNVENQLELKKHLPSIRREDPAAKYIGLRPHNICKIIRPSQANCQYITYRYCNLK